MENRSNTQLNIWLTHPDLGIGGAEMLVVNAATALLNNGHKVKIFTSHHDISRCFRETKPDGLLGGLIFVHGNWLPRSILNRMIAVCAVIRMLWISIVIIIYSLLGNGPDILICDQVRTSLDWWYIHDTHCFL